MSTLAILGAGNMGSALLSGLLHTQFPSHSIWIADPSHEKLNQIEKKTHIHVTTDNQEAVQSAEIIILAVKPDIVPAVLTEIKSALKPNTLVISIAAGILLSTLEKNLGKETAIVRCMPNTPALIGTGASALIANQHVTASQKNTAESILRAVGMTVWLNDEHLMDTVTALSGSGPAYFFLIMEAMEKAAIQLGLPESLAHALTLQTALGAARLALEQAGSLETLREKVTSPHGTTESAIRVLENHQIRDIFFKALSAAKKRSEEIAHSFK